MMNNDLYRKVANSIAFAINNSGIIYYELLLKGGGSDPVYEMHHYAIQARRSRGLGFLRHLFNVSLNSSTFKSHATAITEGVVRDLVEGHFELSSLYSSPNVEGMAKREKNGRYDPRHVRRLVNESYEKEVFDLSTRKADDERKSEKGTIFNLERPLPDNISDEARRLWEQEKANSRISYDLYPSTALSQLLLPEYWQLYAFFRSIFSAILGRTEGNGDVRQVLNWCYEQSDPIFLNLFNHIVSIVTIEDFMTKPARRRKEILDQHFELSLSLKDVDAALLGLEKYMRKGLEVIVPQISLYFTSVNLGYIAIYFLEAMEHHFEGKMRVVFLIELATLYRINKEYPKMLSTIKKADDLLLDSDDAIEKGIVKARLAEAYHFNGSNESVRPLLKEIYELAIHSNNSYVPFSSFMQNVEDVFYREDLFSEEQPQQVPVRISLIANLITACRRIGDCAAEIHYTQRVLEEFSDVLGFNTSMKLHNRLTFLISNCPNIGELSSFQP